MERQKVHLAQGVIYPLPVEPEKRMFSYQPGSPSLRILGAGEGLLALVSTATQQRDSSLCPACPPSSLSICHAPHFLQLTSVHSLTRPTASLDMF